MKKLFNPARLPCDFFAVTAIALWPANFPGPGFIMPDKSRAFSAGFFPLFEAREEAEQVAKAFPGALVFPTPISVAIGEHPEFPAKMTAEIEEPLTLWQELDRVLETEPGSVERQEMFVMFPILGEIGLTDIRNLLDFTTAQDRAESGLNRHSRENAMFEAHLRTIKTALGAMQDLLEQAQNGALTRENIEFSE